MDQFGVRDFGFLGKAFAVSSFRFRGFGVFGILGLGVGLGVLGFEV